MKICISAGGTGGHIYPAFVIGEAITRDYPDAEIRYISSARAIELDIYRKKGIPHFSIEVLGITRKRPIEAIKRFYKIIKATKLMIKYFQEWRPDILFSTGGYSSVPPSIAARILGIPVVLHEQNVIMGLANCLISLWAEKVLLSFPDTQRVPTSFIKETQIDVVGLPVRRYTVNCSDIRIELGIDSPDPIILCIGGSLGAKGLLENIKEVIKTGEWNKYNYILLGAEKHHTDFMKNGNAVIEIPYYDNIPALLKESYFAVCRSGASTIFELIAWAVPSILVPYPLATAKHQEENALYLVKRECAILLPEKLLNADTLSMRMKEIISRHEDMKKLLTEIDDKSTEERIVECIISIIDSRDIPTKR